MAGEFDDIRGRLEGIAEELADLAIVRLRESIDAGGTELPVDERRLTRARRAVENTVDHLRSELGEEVWQAGMHPDLPGDDKVLDNPYTYTDYRSASTREARESIFGDSAGG